MVRECTVFIRYPFFNSSAFIDNRNFDCRRSISAVVLDFALFGYHKFNGCLIDNVGGISFNGLLDKTVFTLGQTTYRDNARFVCSQIEIGIVRLALCCGLPCAIGGIKLLQSKGYTFEWACGTTANTSCFKNLHFAISRAVFGVNVDIVQPLVEGACLRHRNRNKKRLHRACNLIGGSRLNHNIQAEGKGIESRKAVCVSRLCFKSSGIRLVSFDCISGIVQVVLNLNRGGVT